MSLFKRKPWTGKTELLFSDKALTALILPLFLEQLLSVFVGLSDSIMVAQVGEAAVSAVSLVDSIAILLINIFNALATGCLCRKTDDAVYGVDVYSHYVTYLSW